MYIVNGFNPERDNATGMDILVNAAQPVPGTLALGLHGLVGTADRTVEGVFATQYTVPDTAMFLPCSETDTSKELVSA